MKNTQFNLDREFIRWFYEQPYPDLEQNRYGVMCGANQRTVDWHDFWMRQAFCAGAQSMFEDVNGALMDWACAVEGLEPEMLEPCEVYDRARENLHYYIHKQLELFSES